MSRCHSMYSPWSSAVCRTMAVLLAVVTGTRSGYAGDTSSIEKVLDQPMTIELTPVHIADFLYAMNWGAATYMFDWRLESLNDYKKQITSTAPTGKYILPTMHFENMPSRQLLEKMLPPMGLTYVVMPDFIFVSTAKRCRTHDSPHCILVRHKRSLRSN